MIHFSGLPETSPPRQDRVSGFRVQVSRGVSGLSEALCTRLLNTDEGRCWLCFSSVCSHGLMLRPISYASALRSKRQARPRMLHNSAFLFSRRIGQQGSSGAVGLVSIMRSEIDEPTSILLGGDVGRWALKGYVLGLVRFSLKFRDIGPSMRPCRERGRAGTVQNPFPRAPKPHRNRKEQNLVLARG